MVVVTQLDAVDRPASLIISRVVWNRSPSGLWTLHSLHFIAFHCIRSTPHSSPSVPALSNRYDGGHFDHHLLKFCGVNLFLLYDIRLPLLLGDADIFPN